MFNSSLQLEEHLACRHLKTMANFKSVAYAHNRCQSKYKIAIIFVVAQIVVKFQKFVSGSDM